MRMIIPLVQKHCINGITKEDAENLKEIPELDERVTALEQGGGGGSDEYVLFTGVNWSDLFDNNGIALYDMKIFIVVPVYSDPTTLRTRMLAVVEIMKGIEYSQQIRIDKVECYSPYNDGTSGLFIAFNLFIPNGLFWDDTQTGDTTIYYYNHYHGENPSWYNVNYTFTKKTRITSGLMQTGEVYLYVKNYTPTPTPK